MSNSDFFDLPSLFSFRDTMNEVGSDERPSALLVHGPGSIRSGRIGILPGSFDPPTFAHLELAREAREHFRLDHVVFSLSSVIVDKERAEGLCHEDRFLLLGLVTRAEDGFSAAVTNRGLYYEQVLGFRDLFGKKASIYFIVGMDKVVQIFDPKYYEDRDAALRTLFFDAQLIAANRAGLRGDDLEKLLERKENQAYEGRVYPLQLPPSLKDVSSTDIRKAARENAPYQDSVPGVVADFIATTGAYRARYEVRAAAIRSLYMIRGWAENEVDLERVVARAVEPDAEGRSLRDALCRERTSEDELEALLRRLQLCRS